MNRKKRVLKACQYVFATVGILALSYWVFVFLNGRIYQAKQARAFDATLQHESEGKRSPVEPPASTPRHGSPAEGSALARLAIPRIGLESMVIEGTQARDLSVALGHIPGTSLPGQAGNVAIAGHRDTFFRPLRLIRKKDAIQLTTSRGANEYRVVSMDVVPPSDIRVLYPTRRDTLTLVTCYPFDYVGPAPMRLIVRAERVSGDQLQAASKSAYR